MCSTDSSSTRILTSPSTCRFILVDSQPNLTLSPGDRCPSEIQAGDERELDTALDTLRLRGRMVFRAIRTRGSGAGRDGSGAASTKGNVGVGPRFPRRNPFS